jgi:manganese transport protein
MPSPKPPLLALTRRRDVMGAHANRSITNVFAYISTAVILVLNGLLLVQMFGGKF